MHGRNAREIDFWRGWDAAIATASKMIAGLPDDLFTAEQQQSRRGFLNVINGLLPDPALLKPKPTNDQLAEKYAVAPRTITNWRAAGCPFEDGQWRVLDWVSEQRIVPAGAKAKFARQLERRKPDPNSLPGLAKAATSLFRETRGMKRFGVL